MFDSGSVRSTRKPFDSFRWLFCFISRRVFGPVRHKALIFSRLPGLYCFLMQQGMQQGNTKIGARQMSIWDAFGKGRYKGFSREAGQLLDKAVELAGGWAAKRQTPATCCGRCCKRTAARRPLSGREEHLGVGSTASAVRRAGCSVTRLARGDMAADLRRAMDYAIIGRRTPI